VQSRLCARRFVHLAAVLGGVRVRDHVPDVVGHEIDVGDAERREQAADLGSAKHEGPRQCRGPSIFSCDW
jgi:hypothetical protein